MANQRNANVANAYVENGTIIRERLKFVNRIASGGFGQIYEVKLQGVENITLAAKVSRRDVNDFRRLIMEQAILRKLRGKAHVPFFVASGNYREYMFIIMKMLGPDLGKIRRRCPEMKLSIPTVIQFGLQAVIALKDVHELGYLHRDVKPGNFCIGTNTNRRHFYLIDYGMTRHYICDKTGKPRPPRKCAGFRGTARYVSMTVHARKEQGPVDDFWSLLYVLIDLAEGTLPWRQRDEPMTGDMKRDTNLEGLFRELPKEMRRFKEHLVSINQFGEKPRYALLNEILEACFPKDTDRTTLLDWERNPQLLE